MTNYLQILDQINTVRSPRDVIISYLQQTWPCLWTYYLGPVEKQVEKLKSLMSYSYFYNCCLVELALAWQ